MESWAASRKLTGGVTVMLTGFLSACGLSSASSPHPVPKYLPTTVAHVREAGPLSGAASRAVILPHGEVMAVAGSRMLVGLFPTPNPQGSGILGHSGLDIVNLKTGAAQQLVRMPPTMQPNAAAMTSQWIVWEPGLAGTTQYTRLVAENLKTHKSWDIYRVPTDAVATADVKGLDIRGNTAFWLTTITSPRGVITTTIWSYNLGTRHKSVVVSERSNVDHRLIFSMAVAPHAIWYSDSFSGNIYDTSARGQLVERRITAPYRKTWEQPLWHAGTVYGATDKTVVFTANYHKAPNSPQNPGPYPIYEYVKGARKLEQLTGRDAANATLGGRTLVINGSGSQKATLLSLGTKRTYSLPGAYAYTNGQIVVWETQSGRIEWASLSYLLSKPR